MTEKKKKHMITVPNPLPAPIPGGGPRDGYQFIFDQEYYKTRDPKLRGLAQGLSAGLDPTLDQLSDTDQATLANALYDWVAPGGPQVYGPDHMDFDQEIDFGRQEPYAVMFDRQETQQPGYQRVPVGTGTTTQPPEVVKPADLQGPPVKGQYLLVTCDINKL
jgi:hypothetical protein